MARMTCIRCGEPECVCKEEAFVDRRNKEIEEMEALRISVHPIVERKRFLAQLLFSPGEIDKRELFRDTYQLQGSYTLTELQRIFEGYCGAELDKRNFRKKLFALDVVKPTGKFAKGQGRPAELYEVIG